MRKNLDRKDDMANRITVMRFPVLVAVLLLLYSAPPTARLIGAALLIVLIVMDSLDGIVARSRHEESLLGSVLDIMADRAVELVLWIVYADLDLVPVMIPVIFALRGTVVDALRSVYVGRGKKPFDAMKTPLGRWLVGGRVMRSTYGVLKLVSFVGLAVTHALAGYVALGAVSATWASASGTVFLVCSWLATLFCLLRGVPVIVETVPDLTQQTTPTGSSDPQA